MNLSEPPPTQIGTDTDRVMSQIPQESTANLTPIPSYPECVTAHDPATRQSDPSSLPPEDTPPQEVKLSIAQQHEHLQEKCNITFPANLSTPQLHSLIKIIYKNRYAVHRF